MKRKWNDPVVVITGASSGIGKATARLFAKKGAHLVLAARRENLLEELADECEELGSTAIAVDTDVSERDDVEELAARALKKFGRIDIWINNAGVGSVGRFDEIPLEEHEQIIRTNLMGVIYGSAVALRHFRKRRTGTLINVASVEGKQAIAYHASYAASKHAIVGLDSALRQELRLNKDKDIAVCTVMPASINTPFFRHAANHTGKKVVPVPPVYSPEQVASTILAVAINPEDEVYVGGVGRIVGAQKRIAPDFTSAEMGYMQHREQMEKAPPAPNKSGALFDSDEDEGYEAKDEWKESGKYADPTAIALASVLPIAAGLWIWRRMRNRSNENEEDLRGVA